MAEATHEITVMKEEDSHLPVKVEVHRVVSPDAGLYPLHISITKIEPAAGSIGETGLPFGQTNARVVDNNVYTCLGIKHESVDIPMEDETEAVPSFKDEPVDTMTATLNSQDLVENKNPIEEVFMGYDEFNDETDGEDTVPQQGDLDSRDPLQLNQPSLWTATSDPTSPHQDVRPVALILNNGFSSYEVGGTRREDGAALDRGRADEEDRPHACDVCHKRFTRSSSLALHNMTHTGEKPFACDVCDKRYTRSCHLSNHKLMHTGEKPHACQDCGKRFVKSIQLVQHRWTHSVEKPPPCEECGKRFARLEHLDQHRRTHRVEKPPPCEECGKRFAQLKDLERHRRTHIDEKPPPCEDCGKRFLKLADLVRHWQIHIVEKPHPCEDCGKRFTQLADLVRHRWTHISEKPSTDDQ